MITFLEFVLERAMGPAVRPLGNGQSEWAACPFCDAHGHRFHTRPHKPSEKERYGCYACGAFGDCFDAVKMIRTAKYPQRLSLLHSLWAEYAPGVEPPADFTRPGYVVEEQPSAKPTPSTTVTTTTHTITTTTRATSSSPPGTGDDGPTCRVVSAEDRHWIEQVYKWMKPEVREAAAYLYVVAVEYRIPADELLQRCFKPVFSRFHWLRTSELNHFEHCHDPDCNADICSRARGEPPPSNSEPVITDEELHFWVGEKKYGAWAERRLRAELDRAERAAREEHDREVIRHAMRNVRPSGTSPSASRNGKVGGR